MKNSLFNSAGTQTARLPAGGISPTSRVADPLELYRQRADVDSFIEGAGPVVVRGLLESAYSAYRLGQTLLLTDAEYDELELAYARRMGIDPLVIQNEIERTLAPQLFRDHIELPHNMDGLTQLNLLDESHEQTDARIGDYIAANEGVEYDVLDKLDGVSVLLKYEGGRLRQAFSKHSGAMGLDITRHLKLMPTVPQRISVPGLLYVRGEAVMPQQVFADNYSEDEGTGDNANPRNTVAGKLNSKMPQEDVLKHIDFVAYTLCDSAMSKRDQLACLENWNFKVAVQRSLHADQMTSEALDELVAKAKAESIYDLDGVVISPVDMFHGDKARKYKIIAEVATVKIIDIEWNLSKGGSWKPVGIIEPTKLGGVTVTRCNCFHGFYVKHGRLAWEDKPDRSIGPGAIVTIIRSGDVIPDIQEVLQEAEPKYPDEGYIWSANEIHLLTDDPNHPMVKLRRASYFFGMIAVDGFREASVAKCFEAGYDSIESIIHMTQEELQNVLGVASGASVYESLHYQLDGVYMPLLMGAFMGNLLALERSEYIFNYYEGDCFNWDGWTRDEIIGELSQIKGVGDGIAGAFADEIAAFNAFLANTSGVVKPAAYEAAKLASTKLEGWKVVFTGTRLPETEEVIVANGGELASWTKAMIIVTSDKSVMRPKIAAALSRGAKMYDHKEFFALLEDALK